MPNKNAHRTGAHILQTQFLIITFLLATAPAGFSLGQQVRFELWIDPQARNNGCDGCTLDGIGTWDLRVRTLGTSHFGLASYAVPLENATSIIHRSPQIFLVPNPDPEGIGVVPTGFSFVRVPNNSINIGGGGSSTFVASQDYFTPSPNLIRGFGQTGGSFGAQFPGLSHIASSTQPT